MSNRREHIKKTLGITEYPWSSDDETPLDVNETQANENNSNVPETNDYTPDVLPSSSQRRVRTRLEQSLFSTFLNNFNRTPASDPAPGPSQPTTSSMAVSVPPHRVQPETYYERLLAIKRICDINKNLINRHESRPAPRLVLSNSVSPSAAPADAEGLRPMKRSGSAWNRHRIRPYITIRHRTGSAPEVPPTANTANNDVEDRSHLRSTPENGIIVEEDSVEQLDEVATNLNDLPTVPECEDEVDNKEPTVNNTSGESLPSSSKKRKRQDDEPGTVKDFNQNLLSLLECPVCLEWMEPPMSQCRRGHLVCGQCRARLLACPVCRTTFSSVRNRAMEGVAEMLRYPCRYGCGQETRLRLRASHEASCSARRYRCPAPRCEGCAPVPLAELNHHIQTKHLSMLMVGSQHEFSMKVNAEQHGHWMVMVDGDLFYLRVEVSTLVWGIAVHVAYIGPKRNASNFTYEVTVKGEYNERKMVYSRVTHSDLESCDLNVNRQDCFHLTLDQAVNFLRYKSRRGHCDKFLNFTVEIRKRDVPIAAPRPETDS